MMKYWYLIPATAASLLPCIAAGVYVLSRIYKGREPGKPPSQRSVDIFLNRLIHETAYNDTQFISFQVDCFLFDFRNHGRMNLTKELQYGFFDFARTLDLSNQQAIIKLYVWLVQHAVDFKLKFRYNKSLPAKYNWRQRKKPKYLVKLINGIDRRALMDWDLSKDPYALKQPED